MPDQDLDAKRSVQELQQRRGHGEQLALLGP
jgi:hypothetical protein